MNTSGDGGSTEIGVLKTGGPPPKVTVPLLLSVGPGFSSPVAIPLLMGSYAPSGAPLSVQGFTQTGGKALASFSLSGSELHFDPKQFRSLKSGQIETLTFTYGVSDGVTAVPQTLTLRVQGGLNKAVWADYGRADPKRYADADFVDVLYLSRDYMRFTTTIGVDLEMWGRFNFASEQALLDSPLFRLAWGELKVTGFGVTFEAFVDPAVGFTGNDVLLGSDGYDDSTADLNGYGGSDWIAGRGGNDGLAGGDGDDTLLGGEGDDTLYGGAGFDLASFEGAARGVVVDLLAGTAEGEGRDRLYDIEAVRGSPFADRLSGTGRHELLDGGAGDDWLAGGEGNDTVFGGAGNDTVVLRLAGARKAALLDGGAGADTLEFQLARDDLAVVDRRAEILRALAWINDPDLAGQPFQSSLLGLTARGFEALKLTYLATGETLREEALLTDRGGIGAVIDGTMGPDTLMGGAGNDLVIASGADDHLVGGSGADALDGGRGDDTLYGGAEGDVLVGGAGADVFRFADCWQSRAGREDVILDFVNGEDRMDLTGIDAIAFGRNDAFAFIGAGPFTAAGQLRVMQAGPDVWVEGETTGDGGADFCVVVRGALAELFTAADFFL